MQQYIINTFIWILWMYHYQELFHKLKAAIKEKTVNAIKLKPKTHAAHLKPHMDKAAIKNVYFIIRWQTNFSTAYRKINIIFKI